MNSINHVNLRSSSLSSQMNLPDQASLESRPTPTHLILNTLIQTFLQADSLILLSDTEHPKIHMTFLLAATLIVEMSLMKVTQANIMRLHGRLMRQCKMGFAQSKSILSSSIMKTCLRTSTQLMAAQTSMGNFHVGGTESPLVSEKCSNFQKCLVILVCCSGLMKLI